MLSLSSLTWLQITGSAAHLQAITLFTLALAPEQWLFEQQQYLDCFVTLGLESMSINIGIRMPFWTFLPYFNESGSTGADRWDHALVFGELEEHGKGMHSLMVKCFWRSPFVFAKRSARRTFKSQWKSKVVYNYN